MARTAFCLIVFVFAGCASSPPPPPPEPPPVRDGMVLIPAGAYTLGSDTAYPEERPTRRVEIASFWIDQHEVTNAQFAEFVTATGYLTVAERAPAPDQYPGADPALLVPGSAVFTMPAPDRPAHELEWWSYVPGTSWKHPEGPSSSIDERMNHPVVHVAYEDAAAYASWCGKRLPTEDEWEAAARGGLERKVFAWGDELSPGGKFMANTWQGAFPVSNAAGDGFVGTAPAGSFPPNGYGLYDMIGNVWEWTATPGKGAERIVKGGSFLCAPNYCQRYRPSAKSSVEADTGTSHIGFRCATSAERVP